MEPESPLQQTGGASYEEAAFVPRAAHAPINVQLQDWVNRQRLRWLELLTNFGASSLFFISGDALVLEYLREAHLSWGFNAPQYLHFIYAVENFLKKMLDTGCVFRIVFFGDMRRAFHDLVLRPGQPACGPAALLARDMLVKHLKTIGSIEVEESFTNWWSPDWRQYLKNEAPGFVLLSTMYNATGAAVTFLRAFAVHLYAKRVPTSYLAEMQFNDNRAWAFCVEPYNRQWETEFIKGLIAARALPTFLHEMPSRAAAVQSNGTIRSTLAVYASKQLISDKVALDLLKVALLHTACLEHLELGDRAWLLPKFIEGTELPQIVSSFVDTLLVKLDEGLLGIQGNAHDVSLADLFDWRLFALLLHGLLARYSVSGLRDFPASVVDRAKALWSQVSSDLPYEPFFQSPKMKPFVGTPLLDFSSMPPRAAASYRAPLPIRSPITDRILHDMVPATPQQRHYEELRAITRDATVFRDMYHHHVPKRITMDEDALSDPGAGAYGAGNVTTWFI